MLHTEPSLSIYNLKDEVVENDENGEKLERTVTTGESIESVGSGEFSFGKNGMDLIEENDNEEEAGKGASLDEFKSLKIDGGVDSGQSAGCHGNGDLEEYYKRMIREDPSDPFSLKNYAQLLQVKGDLSGAQDYYFRATLADPSDGQILVQYAKFLWEFCHDKDGAMSYFKKAAASSPGDSDVLGAYASFLWDMDEDDEDEDEDESSSGHEQLKGEDGGQEEIHNIDFLEENRPASPPLHLATGLGIDPGGFGDSIQTFQYMTADSDNAAKTEEYYRIMVEEHPLDPLSLRNLARYLSEIKGDLQAAEEYYSRAILADPNDGETLCRYATLIWQLHNDREQASSYFEQAVQAASQDSCVLGAYAKFLWESEDGEDENNLWEAPLHQGEAATANAC